jgi:hypothetical protein
MVYNSIFNKRYISKALHVTEKQKPVLQNLLVLEMKADPTLLSFQNPRRDFVWKNNRKPNPVH